MVNSRKSKRGRKGRNTKPYSAEVRDVSAKKKNFVALSDDDDGSVTDGSCHSDMSVSVGSDKIKNAQNDRSAEVKMPPIVIKSKISDTKAFYADLKTHTENDVHFRTFNTTKQIFTYNANDFAKIKNILTQKNIEYYTYTQKIELCKKLVIKGLDKDLECSEILADLRMQQSAFVDVKQMHIINREGTDKGAEPKREKIGIFIAYIQRNKSLTEVKEEISVVCHHRIVWEKYNKRDNPATFCGKCSRWGHCAKNCNMPDRCLKCSLSHAPDKCSLKKEEVPKCANCEGQHTATNRECPTFKAYIKRRTELASKRNKGYQHNTQRNENSAQRQQPYRTDEFVRNDVSYANMVSSGGNINEDSSHTQAGGSNEQGNNNINFLDNEVNELFGISMVEMARRLGSFLPKYRKVRDKTEKQITLIGFICDICK